MSVFGSGGSPGRIAPPDELSLADFVRPLVHRWRTLLAVPAACAVVALAAALVWPRTYVARTSFTPEQTTSGSLASALGSLGALGGLVGQMGGLPGSNGSALTPDFFAGVLKSRELMVAALLSSYPVAGDTTRRATLLEQLGVRGRTPERRLGNALRKLEKRATAGVDRRTGIVTVSVTLRDPRLAADVANRMVELLNVYNLERRQSSSREQRRFLAGRLSEAQGELHAAEDALSSFMATNRRYTGSPLLSEQANRLERTVRMRQEVFLGLSKSLEDARVAEVRDTPMLTVIDHATPPDRPANPRPVLWAGIAAAIGLLAATALALRAGTRSGAPSAPVATPAELMPWRDSYELAKAEPRSKVSGP